jgi:hypothetical protein
MCCNQVGIAVVMVMRKTDKKLEAQLIEALTQVCEQAKTQYPGFSWLTHKVNFQRFPDSLSLVCVFDTNQELRAFNADAHATAGLQALVKQQLASIGIKPNKAVPLAFDTEENCQHQDNGNWSRRLERR